VAGITIAYTPLALIATVLGGLLLALGAHLVDTWRRYQVAVLVTGGGAVAARYGAGVLLTLAVTLAAGRVSIIPRLTAQLPQETATSGSLLVTLPVATDLVGTYPVLLLGVAALGGIPAILFTVATVAWTRQLLPQQAEAIGLAAGTLCVTAVIASVETSLLLSGLAFLSGVTAWRIGVAAQQRAAIATTNATLDPVVSAWSLTAVMGHAAIAGIAISTLDVLSASLQPAMQTVTVPPLAIGLAALGTVILLVDGASD